MRKDFKPLGFSLREVADKLIFLSDEEGTIWPPLNTKGQMPVTLEPRKNHYHSLKRKCTNTAADAGNQSILIEPAADSILKVYWLGQRNLDTAAREVYAEIATSGMQTIGRLYYKVDLAVNGRIVWPQIDSTNLDWFKTLSATPFILNEDFELDLVIKSVAVSQDSDFFMLYEVIGDEPTITETAPTGAAWTDIS